MEETKWLEVAVSTTPDKLDEVCAKLTAAGMDALVIEDEGDFLRFLEQNKQYWDYVDQELLDKMKGVTRVKFYVTDDEEGKKQLAQYTRGLDWEYTVTPLTDNDWAYSWQKYYKPLKIGKRLYVVPQWMREDPVPEGRVPFYLNPGLTFGTGSHASTQLCLEGVEEHTVPGRPCWIWAAAAVFCPSPPCVWAPVKRWPWTLTPRRWMWPMKTPPSTALERTDTPSARATSCLTRPWSKSLVSGSTTWYWPTLWPM